MDLPRKFEIHYYFSDSSHSMNALIKNRCEAEFLAVATEIADVLGFPFELDCEALREGGVKEVWKALGNNNAEIALVISALAFIWGVIPHTDQELIDLQKEDARLSIEERKLSIEKLKQELDENKLSIDLVKMAASIVSGNYKVVTRKSNFYKTLSSYEKVTKVGFTERDSEDNVVSDEKIVSRSNFQNFMLVSNELEPLRNNNARIEIVAPVLKEGKAKWKGIYDDNPISFSMNDNDFKSAVISKQLSFKNGDEIMCVLLIHKKVDELGNVLTSGYSVEVVLENVKAGQLSETPQGKRYRHNKKFIDSQSDMFVESADSKPLKSRS